MSTEHSDNERDITAEIEALRARGAAELEKARKESETRRAELARIDREEAARLQALESEFAQPLAEKQRELALRTATKQWEDANGRYGEATSTSEKLRAELRADADALIEKYFEALEAEKARVNAGTNLTGATTNLARFTNVGTPNIKGNELNPVFRNSPWNAVATTC